MAAPLSPQTLALAKQGAGKKHQFRSPSEQAAIEAARAAGTPGFRAPTAPPANNLAPSSMWKLPQQPKYAGGQVRPGGGGQRTYVGPDGRRHPLTPRNVYDRPGRPNKTYQGTDRKGRPKEYKGYDKIYTTSTGIYGKGGEKGWLDRWYADLKAMGMPTMSPKEFAKWADLKTTSAAWKGGLAEQRKAFKGNKAAIQSINKYGDLAGSTVKDLDMSHIRNPEALKFFVEKALGQKFGSMADAQKALLPVSTYANHMYNRWLRSGGANIEALSGPGGEAAIPPEIRPYYDIAKLNMADLATFGAQPNNNAMMALYRAVKNPKKGENLRAALTKVSSEMPDWVTRAYDVVSSSPVAGEFRGGAPHLWGTMWEQVNHLASLPQVNGTSGSVNLWNPSLPFVSPTAVGGGALASDDSTARYLASLSPYEFFTEAGLKNAEVLNASNLGLGKYPNWSDMSAADQLAGKWKHPYADLPTYKRFGAYGNLDPEAARKDWRNNFGFDPFQTQGWGNFMNQVPTKDRGYTYEQAKALGVPWNVWLFGAESPQHYQDTYWSTRAAYAPWLLDPATLDRMRRITGWY